MTSGKYSETFGVNLQMFHHPLLVFCQFCEIKLNKNRKHDFENYILKLTIRTKHYFENYIG